ncbi:MAG: trypsin-like peptidase domain-containing protein [Pseudomonadota bacterium]
MNHLFFFARAALLAAAVLASGSAAPAAVPAGSAQQYGLPDFADLVDQVGPAVVAISVTYKQAPEAGEFDRLLQSHFARRPAGESPPKGAGFLISADGYLLTAHAVLRDAEQIFVELGDGREFPARLVGSDEPSNLALLKIDAQQLPRARIGDSGKIRAGEWVLAIGSPYQLSHSVSVGVIAFKSRDTGDYVPYIQSDVMSNPGNAGGPLINLRGEVIGVASMMVTQGGNFQNIAMAVPINDAMEIVEQLKTAGKVVRGVIGVKIDDVGRQAAGKLGLGKARGALVAEVDAGGPADQGGLRSGDIILAFNGQPVVNWASLPRLVGRTPVGGRVGVTVWRDGAQRELALTVGAPGLAPVPAKPARSWARSKQGI